MNRSPAADTAPPALSPELEALALQVARLSRLPRRMRGDIADQVKREIARLLREGASTAEVPGRLGDPARLARELRRERLGAIGFRRRVLAGWKGVVLGILMTAGLIYGGMLAWFHTARPRISRNFAAEYNAKFDAMGKDSLAEALYLEAIAELPDLPPDLLNVSLSDLRPGDPLWSNGREFLRKASPAMAKLRQAAAMPTLGLRLSDEGSWGWSLTAAGRAIKPTTPASENPNMIAVVLPHLGVTRGLARYFAGDALEAAEAGDGLRASADLHAIIGFARHCREAPFLICDLVTIAVVSLDASRLELLLEKYPGLFSEAQLAALQRDLEKFPLGPDAVRFEGERLFMEDLLQRVYTDNGNGDGRICAAGLRLWHSMAGMTGSTPTTTGLTPVEWAFGPVIAFTSASRKEFLAEYNRCMDMTVAFQRRPMWSRVGAQLPDAEIERRSSEAGWERKFWLLKALMPALGAAVRSGDRATLTRDGAVVAVALERYRLAHGRFPEKLGELTPAYLAAIPRDLFDGNPLRYRLVDGKPVVYSIGIDGDDDGGRPPAGKNPDVLAWKRQAGVAADGDFVLWPEPRPQPFTPPPE